MLNTFQHIRLSTATLLRVYTMYQPFKVFLAIGSFLFIGGFLVGTRFVYYAMLGNGMGHIQSLILAGVLMVIGFQVIMTGIVADLIGINRKLLENSLRRIKQIEIGEKRVENNHRHYPTHSIVVN